MERWLSLSKATLDVFCELSPTLAFMRRPEQYGAEFIEACVQATASSSASLKSDDTEVKRVLAFFRECFPGAEGYELAVKALADANKPQTPAVASPGKRVASGSADAAAGGEPQRKRRKVGAPAEAEGSGSAQAAPAGPPPTSVSDVRGFVRKRILEACPTNLVGLDYQVGSLYEMLRHAISTKENSSVLLTGAHGTGKTAALEHCLRRLATELPAKQDAFVWVRLNGLMHGDNRGLARALCNALAPFCQFSQELESELQVDARANKAKRAQTFLTKSQRQTISDVVFSTKGTLEDVTVLSEQTLLSLMTDMVLECDRPIVLSLQHFEQIAASCGKTLYALLDVVHETNTCMFVNAMDLLEKRVKSRFSHRQIFFTEFQSVGSPMALLREYFAPPNVVGSDGGQRAILRAMTQGIGTCVEDPRVSEAMEDLISQGCTASDLLLLQRSNLQAAWSPDWFLACLRDASKTGTDRSLEALTLTELILCVCMCRIHEREHATFTFEDVYSDYMELVSGKKRGTNTALDDLIMGEAGRPYTPAALRRCFAHLCDDLGLVMIVSARDGKFALNVRSDELRRSCLRQRSTLPTYITHWVEALGAHSFW